MRLAVVGCGDDVSPQDASPADASSDAATDARDSMVIPDAGTDPLCDGLSDTTPPMRICEALATDYAPGADDMYLRAFLMMEPTTDPGVDLERCQSDGFR